MVARVAIGVALFACVAVAGSVATAVFMAAESETAPVGRAPLAGEPGRAHSDEAAPRARLAQAEANRIAAEARQARERAALEAEPRRVTEAGRQRERKRPSPPPGDASNEIR